MLTMMTTSKATESDMLAVKQTELRPLQGVRAKGKLNAEKINDTASEFEAQFISQMLSNMFSTVEPNEELGGGDAEEMYQSMLQNEYGKIIARTGGVGVADQVKRIMIEQQEVE